MQRHRILVVDDHALFRDGLCALVGRWSEFEVVGCAANGPDGLDLASQVKPDLVLVDLRMRGMDGLEVTKAVIEHLPTTKVVVLTMSDLGDDVVKALQHGAHGYLSKDDPADQLHANLLGVMRGEVTLSSTVAAKVLAELAGAHPAYPLPAGGASVRMGASQASQLTSRERDVLSGLVDGLSNEEIARKLRLSEATIKKHIGRIMSKWHMKNRVQLAVHGVRHGIVN
ncbi:MAG: response regulator transcription factor [Micrococcales bacterium]|nr:response regulator transcription factor [Micrococcales bacterium]